MVCALGASACWATANLFIQDAGRRIGELRALFWAQACATGVLAPAAWLFGERVGTPSAADVGVTAVGSALGYYGMLRAFRRGPLSVITPIVASWVVPACVFGMVWLGERPTPSQLVGALLVVVGAAGNGALARGGGWDGPAAPTIAWAVGSSVGFGLMTAGVSRVREQAGALSTLPLVWFAQWVVLLPALARAPGVLRPPEVWRGVLGMALTESVGFVLYSAATSYAPVTVVSPPASISALLTIAWVGLSGRERVGAARWLCVGAAAAGTVLLAR